MEKTKHEMHGPDITKYHGDEISDQWRSKLTAAGGIDLTYQSAETRRVLFISYSFPPRMEVGAHTCAQIARYLPIHGWQPIVLTVKEKYREEEFPERHGAGSSVESGIVIRTSMLPHPLGIYRQIKSNWLVNKLFRAGGQRATSSNGRAGNQSGLIDNSSARDLLLSMLSTPDIYTGWLIPAIISGLRAIRRTKVQAIYSSAPHFTNHLAGYALAILSGLPWIAHFRDPWFTGLSAEYSFAHFYLKGSRVLERMTVERADAVVCVTEEHAVLMRAAYDQMPASKFAVVMNGFDGLEWEEVSKTVGQSPQFDGGAPRKFRITYTGVLYMKRNPAPLFRALRTLIDAGEIERDEVSVELIGWCESSEGRNVADLIAEAGLEDCVSITGLLNHFDTLRRMMQSDLLLLLAEGLVTQIPGKTFEYLKSHRPILALTSEGAVANLLRQTGGGWVIAPNNHDGVVAAVRECYQSWKRQLPERAPDSSIVESFDRRRTTGRIAELLNHFAT